MPTIDLGVLYVDNNNNVQFGFNNSNSPDTVTGTEWLIQAIVIRLFTELGSDGYSPNFGTHLYEIIGSNFSEESVPQMKTSLTLAVDAVKTSIIQEQAGDSSLSDNEILSDLVIDKIEDAALHGRWYIDLIVVTKSNEMFYLKV